MRKRLTKGQFTYGIVKHPVIPIEFVNVVAFLYVLNIFIPLPQVHTALCRLQDQPILVLYGLADCKLNRIVEWLSATNNLMANRLFLFRHSCFRLNFRQPKILQRITQCKVFLGYFWPRHIHIFEYLMQLSFNDKGKPEFD